MADALYYNLANSTMSNAKGIVRAIIYIQEGSFTDEPLLFIT
jgi:hypothetical protein